MSPFLGPMLESSLWYREPLPDMSGGRFYCIVAGSFHKLAVTLSEYAQTTQYPVP